MYIKKSLSRRIFEVINAFFMLLIVIICLAPLWHVFMASFSDPAVLSQHDGIVLWPLGKANLEGYKIVLGYSSILTGYANTIFYVVVGTVLSTVVTSIAAYVLSRRDFLPRNSIMLFISITMLFNGGMIPNYMLIRDLGLYDNRLALILPGCINVFNLIIIRTSFLSLPASLEESAKLDGASDMQILFRIILPLSKAVIACTILFTAVGIWNSWFNAMIYLKSEDKYPLQLILEEMLVQNDNQVMTASDAAGKVDLFKELVKYCAIVVSTLPILFVYPFVQKYFEKGVLIGAIKG